MSSKRYKVHPIFLNTGIMPGMKDDKWRERLLAAIEATGRTDRDISKAAGLGPNFVGQLKRDGKTARIDSILALCWEIGIGASYLFTGKEVTANEEELLSLYASLPPEDRRVFESFLRKHVEPSALKDE